MKIGFEIGGIAGAEEIPIVRLRVKWSLLAKVVTPGGEVCGATLPICAG